jgi:cholest-4-en-3-one 26-monooxygenase
MTSDQTLDSAPAINLLDGRFYAADPHPALTWLRRNDPVYYDEASNVWGIMRYADVRAVSTSPQLFSNSAGMRAEPYYEPSPMMIDMDDPAHARRRNLVNKGFTPRQVQGLEARIRHICDYLIDTVCEKGEADFVADLTAQLPLIVIGDMLGSSAEDRAMLLRLSDELMTPQLQDDGTPVPYSDRGNSAMEEYATYALQAIAQRRATGAANDLLGVLVHAEVDGSKLSDEELIHESLLLLIGGDETTRHVISGGWEQLIQHPDQLERLRADPGLIGTAVEEMLRWVTPLKNMARLVMEDTEFHGKQLRKGQKVLLMYPSANRDEEVFDDPFTFDIGRQPNNHLAFGVGTHFCLGSNLARLEIRVMTEQILARLPDLELAGDRPCRASNLVSGIEKMPVRFRPTAPLGVAPA